jgi:hypothetical protein
MQQQLSTALIELIKSIKDEENNDLFAQIVDYMPSDDELFEGTPYGFLVPEQTPADYGTNAQNDRREGFEFHVCIPLESGKDRTDINPRAKVFDDMRKINGYVKNAIDTDETIDGLYSPDMKSHVMEITPVSSGWYFARTGMGETLIATINIIVRYTFNIR